MGIIRDSYTAVTKELYERTLDYLKEGRLTRAEIAAITTLSTTTIGRIANGEYDEKFCSPGAGAGEGVTTTIPYKELKRLLACETIVNMLLESATLMEQDDTRLFISSGNVRRAFEYSLLEEYTAKVKELQSGDKA